MTWKEYQHHCAVLKERLLTQIGECSEEAVWGAPFTHFGSYRMCEKRRIVYLVFLLPSEKEGGKYCRSCPKMSESRRDEE